MINEIWHLCKLSQTIAWNIKWTVCNKNLNIQLYLIACLLSIEVFQCAKGWKGPWVFK